MDDGVVPAEKVDILNPFNKNPVSTVFAVMSIPDVSAEITVLLIGGLAFVPVIVVSVLPKFAAMISCFFGSPSVTHTSEQQISFL